LSIMVVKNDKWFFSSYHVFTIPRKRGNTENRVGRMNETQRNVGKKVDGESVVESRKKCIEINGTG
jgi:hypothetical protein